jgi:hypothetical protein
VTRVTHTVDFVRLLIYVIISCGRDGWNRLRRQEINSAGIGHGSHAFIRIAWRCLGAALALPRTPGRSAEVFVNGDLEVRFAARSPTGYRFRIRATNCMWSPAAPTVIESRTR